MTEDRMKKYETAMNIAMEEFITAPKDADQPKLRMTPWSYK